MKQAQAEKSVQEHAFRLKTQLGETANENEEVEVSNSSAWLKDQQVAPVLGEI